MSNKEGKIDGPKRIWQDYETVKNHVVSILKDNPNGFTGAEIASRIGLTPGAVSKYLSMMNVDGIVISRSIGVAKLWKLVTSVEKADVLAGKLSSKQETSFKDYAMSISEIDDELIEPKGTRVIVMPALLLQNLYRYTKSILGDEVHGFFYQWGKDFGKQILTLLVEMTPRAKGIDIVHSFLLLLRLEGWGKFELTRSSESEIEVKWQNSLWAEKDADEENRPIDDFISGSLTAVSSSVLKAEWQFREVECKALGAKLCLFKGHVIQT